MSDKTDPPKSKIGEIHAELKRLEELAKADGFQAIADRIAAARAEAERLDQKREIEASKAAEWKC